MKKQEQNKHVDYVPIIGFIINLLIPGLGTIIFGEYEPGIVQLVLMMAAVLILFSNFPSAVYLLMIAAIIIIWAWALITGIKELKKKK